MFVHSLLDCLRLLLFFFQIFSLNSLYNNDNDDDDDVTD